MAHEGGYQSHPADGDGWDSYRRLVMSEFERLSKGNTNLEKKIDDLSTQVTVLTVKSSIYGALGGILAAIGVVLMNLAMRGGK